MQSRLLGLSTPGRLRPFPSSALPARPRQLLALTPATFSLSLGGPSVFPLCAATPIKPCQPRCRQHLCGAGGRCWWGGVAATSRIVPQPLTQGGHRVAGAEPS